MCENDFLPTLALVLLGLGGLAGNYIFGYLQDGLGRKPSFFIYLFIQCLFGTATAFAQNFTIWTLCRIGVGFTIPAILGTPYVLGANNKNQCKTLSKCKVSAVELVGPKQRTTVTILVNIAYSLALVALSLVVWTVRDWRMLALVTTLPFIGLFAFWWVLPESPRWLLAQDRNQEAEQLLKKIAKYTPTPATTRNH